MAAAESEGGQKFLPPNPLPFCPPERKLSEISVRIFAEKSSDFVQDRQPVLKGIGPETADSILLYALDKPVFVIDEYTKRLVKKHNLTVKTDYYLLQKLFEKNLRKDLRLYQDFHALIVIDGKNEALEIKKALSNFK